MIRYFANQPAYGVVMRTFRAAIPVNLTLMAGVLPIFIGYGLLIMATFWHDREHFGEPSTTFYSLWCMMNGDSTLGIFGSTTAQNNILGFLTIYTWGFFSVCVVQNMNFVIVEDAYLNVKYKTSYSWLTGD